MTYRIQVNRYRGFHNYHIWIISCAEEKDVGRKWWQGLEITEGKTWIKALIFKWKMSPRLFVCCCQISVPEKVSFYRREEGEGVLRGRNASHTCVHLYNIHHTCTSLCSPSYPSLLFNIRINVLNPKKDYLASKALWFWRHLHNYTSFYKLIKTEFLKKYQEKNFWSASAITVFSIQPEN